MNTQPVALSAPEPQVAFHQWLRESFERLVEGFRLPPGEDDFLSRAVDPADLERRMRIHERGMSGGMFW